MAHKGGLEALNRSLRDICNCEKLFGGLTVLICRDFQQILPVVKIGTPADELKACVKSSYLWHKVTTMTLRRNKRAHYRQSRGWQMGSQVAAVGSGEHSHQRIWWDWPDNIRCQHCQQRPRTPVQDLPLPGRELLYKKSDWLRDQTILAPCNDIVKQINASLMAKMPGESVVYRSYDQTTEVSEAPAYPLEVLNSQNPPGLPPH